MNPYSLLQEPGHEGKFTAQFKARKPHLRHLKSLKEFAHYILAHPTEFNKISKQRSNYYRNLIEKKGGMKKNKEPEIPKGIEMEDISRIRNRQIEKQRHLGMPNYPSRSSLSSITASNPSTDDSMSTISLSTPRNSFDSNPNPNRINELFNKWKNGLTEREKREFLHLTGYLEASGRGRLSKKMMKDLRAYHKQVGGKISAKDFELMLKETYKSPDKRDKHIGDYYIDESLSTPENVVYHNPKTNETKVAYRGTEGTLADWSNNAKYALGLHNTTKRYKRSNEIQKQVEQKYGTDQLDVLGHSQSGAFAQEIGKNAKNVVVLNPASHPLYSPKTKNTTVVRSKGDSVSALKYLNPFNWGKKADVEIEAKTYNPITEHMPSILERLPEDTILGNGRKRKKVKRNKKLRNLCNCGMCAYCR